MARGKKTGGRVQGVSNKRTEEIQALFKRRGFNPLNRMMTIAQDTTIDISIRAQMLKELAKYFAPQLKAVEVNAQVTHWTPELIATLSDAQLQMFMATFHQQQPGLAVVDQNEPWVPLPEGI